MGIFRRRDSESMDPQELLARGHADMAESSAAPADDLRGGRSATFRLTVVDVFTIRGRGTVVTGQVESGSIMIGAAVRVERSGQVIARTVIAGIEQFRKIVDEAHEGDNVGLLVRSLAADSVRAGDVLCS